MPNYSEFTVKKSLIALVFICFSILGVKGQEKQFFSRLGESCSEINSYFYQVNKGGDSYNIFYTSNDQLFFEGRIVVVANSIKGNKYAGKCKWYFKNGQPKITTNYSEEGLKDGESVEYYESGKVWKKITYVKGKIKGNRYKEYEEDGGFSQVFFDDFINNSSDWAVYTTDMSDAKIEDGGLIIESKSDRGSARFLSFGSASNYSFEMKINGENSSSKAKRGMIYGFKDWENYSYFLIKGSSVYVGSVFEGVNNYNIEGMFDDNVSEEGDNDLKLISMGGRDVFSINGKVVYKRDKLKLLGTYFGFVVAGKGTIKVDEVKHKGYESTFNSSNDEDLDVKASGSGVVLSSSGYILTNNHVIEDAKELLVEIHKGGAKKSYKAKLIQTDAVNDLAILKIEDPSFTNTAKVKYSLSANTLDVGTSVFTLGFPLALSGLGNEVKFVDGKISSKTGYENALNSYQTSIPVQPGNSGGPVFNNKGELVGVVNAKINGADNVSYVVKMNYIKPLIEVLPETISFPTSSSLSSLSTEAQVKSLKELVVLIKVK